MAAKVISVVNNKGGVGKTTTCIFLGEILSLFGKKTLLIDTDESGNLSFFFNHFTEDSRNVMSGIDAPDQPNITEVFKYRFSTEDELRNTICPINENLDLIPSSKRFNSIPDFLLLQSRTSNINNNIILKRAIKSISDIYDYIIIDTAPSNDIITINSLMASDGMIIPVQSESFSLKGLKEIITNLSELIEEYDIPIEFLGAFQTAAEINTNVFKDSNEDYEQLLGSKNLPCIRKDIKVKEALKKCVGDELIKYTMSSNVLYDYCMLLISMNILDQDTANLIQKAYEQVEE